MQTNSKVKYITLTGVMAGLITLFTAYFVHIPVGLNGGYIHLGDALIYLAAAILPTPYAMIAGAIGGGLADLLTAPAWTAATVIIKMLIVLPFTPRGSRILGSKRNIIAPIISFFISATGYYIADYVLFGTVSALIASFSGSLVQSGGSAIVFYIVGTALDRVNIKGVVFPDNSHPENETNLKRNEGEVHG